MKDTNSVLSTEFIKSIYKAKNIHEADILKSNPLS